MKYKITDINSAYLKLTIKESREAYEEFHKTIREAFGPKAAPYSPTSVKKYDPVLKKEREFPFPLAYEITLLYYFVTNKIDKNVNIDGEKIDMSEKVIKLNEQKELGNLFPGNAQWLPLEEWRNLRLGFLCYMAELKIRLLEGKDDFTAVEVGTLIGVTGQAIVNRIKRGQIKDVGKRHNKWELTNGKVREIIKSEDLPFKLI